MTPEIDDIIKSIELRNSRLGVRLKIKMHAWNAAVWFAYALKRAMDILLAGGLIVIFTPFFIIVSLVIKLTSKGPIIFKQIRVGRNGRHFKFYKFRSMRTDAEIAKKNIMSKNESSDGVIFKMKKDPRLTPIGGFIRKYSIDELPQLFNVLIGDMSLVGPRPPLPSEVVEYTLEDRKRLHIKPGITCLWQISGRSDIPFRQQVQLDEQYIKSSGFWADFKILLRTIPAVVMGKGAY